MSLTRRKFLAVSAAAGVGIKAAAEIPAQLPVGPLTICVDLPQNTQGLILDRIEFGNGLYGIAVRNSWGPKWHSVDFT